MPTDVQTQLPLRTLRDVRQHHHVRMDDLAREARVPLRTVYLIEIGCAVEKVDVVRTLWAISRLTKHRYTLSDIPAISIKGEILG